MPNCLPTIEAETHLDIVSGYSLTGKIVDHPDPYSKFPRYTHKNHNKSTITLAHPVVSAAERSKTPIDDNSFNTTRYKYKPQASSPFADGRTDNSIRGTKRITVAQSSFKVTEHNNPPETGVVCRKPVARPHTATTHGTGKKATGACNKNSLSTLEVKTAADMADGLRSSGRYANSRRFNEATTNITHHNPIKLRAPQLGVDTRYRFTATPKSLEGVLNGPKDNFEDRTSLVQPPPWARDLSA